MENVAAAIQEALRTELGLTSEQVTVSSTWGTSARVEVKDRSVALHAVRDVALSFQVIYLDEWTGEDLVEDSTYVEVDYSGI